MSYYFKACDNAAWIEKNGTWKKYCYLPCTRDAVIDAFFADDGMIDTPKDPDWLWSLFVRSQPTKRFPLGEIKEFLLVTSKEIEEIRQEAETIMAKYRGDFWHVRKAGEVYQISHNQKTEPEKQREKKTA